MQGSRLNGCIGAGTAQAAPSRGHGAAILISPPTVESVTPPMESSVPPLTNPGTLAGPAEFGLPAVNSGTIVPLNQQTITNQPNFGALAPNPGTSAAGFGSPNTNTGTTPSLNNGG